MTALPTTQREAVRRLLNQVLVGTDVAVPNEGDGGRALLDTAAEALRDLRSRALRVGASSSGSISLSNLMAQITGQPDLAAHDDQVLEQGFQALTVLDSSCDRVVLLISDAHRLQRAALRYVQFACRAGAKLQLVVAGNHEFFDMLAADEFAPLRARLAVAPGSDPAALPVPKPPAPMHSPPAHDVPALPTPGLHASADARLLPGPALPAGARRQSQRVAWVAAGLGMTALVALGLWTGQRGWRAPQQHAPSIMELATPATPPPTATANAQQPGNGAPAAMPGVAPPEAEPPSVTPSANQAELGPKPPEPEPPLAAAPGTPQPPSQDVGRRATAAPRVATVARPPGLRPRNPQDWEAPSPPPQAWQPSPAASSAPEQPAIRPPQYIGTYTTDANGVRKFRLNP